MKKILYILAYIANVVLVFLVAWALGINIYAAINKRTLAIYLLIALVLYGIETWIIDRIRGVE